MQKESIVLIGGGGHCKSVIEVIQSNNQFVIAGILDVAEKVGQSICGVEIIGTDDDLLEISKRYFNFHVTVGQIKSSGLRAKLFQNVLNLNRALPPIIAKSAVVSRYANIGQGCAIMHQAMLNAEAQIGDNTIINTGALIEHETKIGRNTHISTHAVINGNCTVGDNCFIGSNTVVANKVHIGDNIIVAAGSAVFKSIHLPGIYLGFPLRKIK